MTINVIVRKDAISIITESLALAAMAHEGTINIDLKPGAISVVLEDGASAAEIAALLGTET